MSNDESRFVYMYLDTANGAETPVYIGRGTSTRVESHDDNDPNVDLAKIIEMGEYSVEILDCGDDRTAKIVEGGLISAMRGRTRIDLKNRRHDQYNFTPLGVPRSLASRRGENALTPTEIAGQVRGNVLYVRIGPRALNDQGRGCIDPGNPSDKAVADRLIHWWYIPAQWIETWQSNCDAQPMAPIALVGIAGHKHRYIVGSIDLRDFDWGMVESAGRQIGLPSKLAINPQIDAYGLRGRTVREGAIFGRAKWEHVRLYGENGRIDRPAP